METRKNTSEQILKDLLKEPFARHSATSLASTLGITRQGLWKSLIKLSKQKLINIENINNKKTSVAIIKLNWSYPLTEKTLSLIITKESFQYERWADNFKELKEHVNFLFLFGSILHSPKTAKDIDILAVVDDKSNFKKIDEAAQKIQISQTKKIHLIDLTENEFKNELKKSNKAYLDAIKKGVVLHGSEKFIQFIKEVNL